MAVTIREQQIIDLYEAGFTDAQIAKQLGLSTSYVHGRISWLCHGLVGGRDEDAIRSATRTLGNAVEAYLQRRTRPAANQRGELA